MTLVVIVRLLARCLQLETAVACEVQPCSGVQPLLSMKPTAGALPVAEASREILNPGHLSSIIILNIGHGQNA